jgi:hypothetical protein
LNARFEFVLNARFEFVLNAREAGKEQQQLGGEESREV